MTRLLLPVIVFACLVALLGVGLTYRSDGLASPLIGKSAPPFRASTLTNPETTISVGDLTGKPAVVNVWASWCVACRREHEVVMALARRIPVYGLNYKDDRTDARQWLAQRGNAYRATIYDPDGDIGLDWGVYGVPETYLLDARGIVRYKHVGAMTDRTVEEELMPRIRRLRQERG